MAIAKKSDLTREYIWESGNKDNGEKRGKPDSVFLNRRQGYEVLYFIKELMAEKGLNSQKSVNKIEELIHKCPSIYRSRKNIKAWIKENW